MSFAPTTPTSGSANQPAISSSQPALEGVDVVVEVEKQRGVGVRQREVDEVRVVERRGAVGRPHHHAAQVGALLDGVEIAHGVGIARVVVNDDELGVAPVHRLVEQLDALLQEVQAVARGDDDGDGAPVGRMGRPAQLHEALPQVVAEFGQERLGMPVPPLGRRQDGLAGVLVGGVGEVALGRPAGARMVQHEREVGDPLRRQFIRRAQQQVGPSRLAEALAQRAGLEETLPTRARPVVRGRCPTGRAPGSSQA
jgi:hypothetical protein